ncbi:hypothetical protein ACFQ3Z_32640 [Streptomyces nogalater]
MADRTRVRQPLLPVLVRHVEERYERLASLLEAASPVPLGESFEHQGRRFTRTNSREDRRRAKILAEPTVRVTDDDTGELIHVTMAEDSAFWEWVAVEILRHSGIRVEELVELTHLSIRQYERPNGEVIALLVVAPSKSERERVIPMSAELFHAVAQIIRRHTRNGQAIPLVSRYDGHEKVWSDAMPFLFQRQIGTVRGVIAPATVLNMIGRSCEEIAETNPAFAAPSSPRTTSALRDRHRQRRPADPHRSGPARTPKSPNHSGLRRGLRRGHRQALPGVPEPPPGPAARARVRRRHPRGMGGVRRTLRQAQGRTRQLRSTLRITLPA